MLEVRGIHSYYGQAHILSDVSLTLAQGEIVVLLGRNGAGKSTTIKSIMGMVKVGAGSISYEGAEILGEPAHRIARRGLGYVPEERRIFTRLTVQENLDCGQQPAREGTRTWRSQDLYDLFPNLAAARNRLAGCTTRRLDLVGLVRVADGGQTRHDRDSKTYPGRAYQVQGWMPKSYLSLRRKS